MSIHRPGTIPYFPVDRARPNPPMDKSSKAPLLDRKSIQVRQVRSGLQQTYSGRLERRPGDDGVIEASFSSGEAPAVRVGQHVDLCYLEGADGTPRSFVAQVLARRLENGGIGYQFRVKTKPRDGRALDISQRASDRVEVDEHAAQTLLLSAPEPGSGPEQSGYLVDLSASGAQAIVPIEVEAALFDSDIVHASFQLGGARAERCELEAMVRWRKLEGSEVRYGLQFSGGSSPESERSRQLIAAYVAERLAAGAGAPLHP